MPYPKFDVLYYKVSPCTAKKLWDISSLNLEYIFLRLRVKNLFGLHRVNFEQ
jgi:hypothetical protein